MHVDTAIEIIDKVVLVVVIVRYFDVIIIMLGNQEIDIVLVMIRIIGTVVIMISLKNGI